MLLSVHGVYSEALRDWIDQLHQSQAARFVLNWDPHPVPNAQAYRDFALNALRKTDVTEFCYYETYYLTQNSNTRLKGVAEAHNILSSEGYIKSPGE